MFDEGLKLNYSLKRCYILRLLLKELRGVSRSLLNLFSTTLSICARRGACVTTVLTIELAVDRCPRLLGVLNIDGMASELLLVVGVIKSFSAIRSELLGSAAFLRLFAC